MAATPATPVLGEFEQIVLLAILVGTAVRAQGPAVWVASPWEHVLKMKKGTVFGGEAEVGITIEELLRREAK